MIRHLANIALGLLPPSRCFWLRNFLLGLSSVSLGEGAKVCGRGWIYGRGHLVIGSSTWLSPGAIFYTHADASISIGSSCDIGPGVEFITGTHEIGSCDRRAGLGFAQSITIGNGCWIGAKCVILGGVNIGSGCIVAAGSVVTKNIPSNSLAAGVPAVIKREL